MMRLGNLFTCMTTREQRDSNYSAMVAVYVQDGPFSLKRPILPPNVPKACSAI